MPRYKFHIGSELSRAIKDCHVAKSQEQLFIESQSREALYGTQHNIVLGVEVQIFYRLNFESPPKCEYIWVQNIKAFLDTNTIYLFAGVQLIQLNYLISIPETPS